MQESVAGDRVATIVLEFNNYEPGVEPGHVLASVWLASRKYQAIDGDPYIDVEPSAIRLSGPMEQSAAIQIVEILKRALGHLGIHSYEETLSDD